MTRRKEPSSYPEITGVRMNVEDLVNELRKYHDKKIDITASTDLVEFEDFDDIKNNSQQLSEKTLRIEIDNVIVFIYMDNVNIRIYSSEKGEKTRDIATNLHKFFSTHSSFIYTLFFRIVILCISAMIFSFIISISILNLIEHAEIGDDARFFLVIIITCASFACAVSLNRFVGNRSIIYAPNKGFWQRNRDKILLMLVSAIITLIIAVMTPVLDWVRFSGSDKVGAETNPE